MDNNIFKKLSLSDLIPNDQNDNFDKGQKLKLEIENCYNNFIKGLHYASTQTIPLKREKIENFWWDAELDQLKSSSFVTHKNWVDAGRPRSGLFFDDKTRAKKSTKIALRKRRNFLQIHYLINCFRV